MEDRNAKSNLSLLKQEFHITLTRYRANNLIFVIVFKRKNEEKFKKEKLFLIKINQRKPTYLLL